MSRKSSADEGPVRQRTCGADDNASTLALKALALGDFVPYRKQAYQQDDPDDLMRCASLRLCRHTNLS